MILAFDKSLRKSPRQAGHQPPQCRQVLALWLKPFVVVEDTEGFAEVVTRRVDLLCVGYASTRGSIRSSDMCIIHDDTSHS